MDGRVTNKTGETILVYGPKLQNETQHNSLYFLPSGRKTPDDWDCDGFFCPSDRIARQLLGDVKGPLAVKYYDFRSPVITMPEVPIYKCEANDRVFSAGEVKWEIPNIKTSQIPGFYPEVPNHLPA